MRSIFIFISNILIASLAVAEDISESKIRFVGDYYNVSMNTRSVITLKSDSTYRATH